jgi:hypothetical protein
MRGIVTFMMLSRPRGWEARPKAPPVELLETHEAVQTRP